MKGEASLETQHYRNGKKNIGRNSKNFTLLKHRLKPSNSGSFSLSEQKEDDLAGQLEDGLGAELVPEESHVLVSDESHPPHLLDDLLGACLGDLTSRQLSHFLSRRRCIDI